MTDTMTALVSDLVEETRDLDTVLTGIGPGAWNLRTPAVGWSIRDQVSHLAFFDDATTLSLRDPVQFRTEADALMARGANFPDQVAADYRRMPVAELRAWLREARRGLVDVLAGMDARDRMPWYGPDMSARSAATARLMETWAHGRDIADALGVIRLPTDRLRHVAQLGVLTREFSYALRDREAPAAEIRVELRAPSGTTWTWGPENAAETITGPAEDFCLVVTQRRHPDDTSLRADGPAGADWLRVAQAFAGVPGPGRARLTAPRSKEA
jgi:uncharacterized protein (TIGR03084 family)